MNNIKFKGIFKDEKQLQTCKVSDSDVKFKESEDINKFLLEGASICIPLVIGEFFMAAGIIYDLFMRSENGLKKDIIFSIVLSGLIIFISQFTHEIIHALFFPKEALKEIYISKDFCSLFVYCTEKVSKMRFIIVSAAPNVIQGIIPFLIAVLCEKYFPTAITMILLLVGGISIIVGVGDYYNIFNADYQVPNGAYVFNNGLHTYWNADRDLVEKNKSDSDKVFNILLMSIGCALLYFSYQSSLLLFFMILMNATVKKDRYYVFMKWISLGFIILAECMLQGLL